ncbi:MAG: hypothetical protein HY330_05155 [Chloroflexi bacterium]|nr:hypothetical protein [Chloroflexota bacterium]
MELEKRGRPTAVICTDEFAILGQTEARSLGVAGLPVVLIPHPLGSLPPEAVQERGRAVAGEVSAALTRPSEQVDADYAARVIEPKGRLRHKPIFD